MRWLIRGLVTEADTDIARARDSQQEMSAEKLVSKSPADSKSSQSQSKSYYCFDKNGQPVFLPEENGTDDMSQSSSSTRNRSRSTSSMVDEDLNISSALEDGLIQYLPATYERLLKQAINNFNRSPMTARDFLVARRMLIGSPNDIAQFIFENRPKLSKKKLGYFLGQSNSFNQKVCDCLLLKYSFEGLSVDEALRSVVRLFCLPKEAQQIDRIIEKFANVYFNQNLSRRHMPCRSADAAHVLVFSILMLNTDLYNKSVTSEKKMTKEQFITNNKGLNDGVDFNAEFLSDLYDNIKTNEIKMDLADLLERDEVTFIAPVKAGWLNKQASHPVGGQHHFGGLLSALSAWQWSKRWFILNDGCLYYFKRPGDKNPRCIIPLENVLIERVGGGGGSASGTGTGTSTAVGVAGSSNISHHYQPQQYQQQQSGERRGEVEYTEWMNNPSAAEWMNNPSAAATHAASSAGGVGRTVTTASSSSEALIAGGAATSAASSSSSSAVNMGDMSNGGVLRRRSSYTAASAAVHSFAPVGGYHVFGVADHNGSSSSSSHRFGGGGFGGSGGYSKDSCLLVITCGTGSSINKGGNSMINKGTSGSYGASAVGELMPSSNSRRSATTGITTAPVAVAPKKGGGGGGFGIVSELINTLKSSKIDTSGAITLTKRKRLVLKASSPEERDEWAAALQSEVVQFTPHERPQSNSSSHSSSLAHSSSSRRSAVSSNTYSSTTTGTSIIHPTASSVYAAQQGVSNNNSNRSLYTAGDNSSDIIMAAGRTSSVSTTSRYSYALNSIRDAIINRHNRSPHQSLSLGGGGTEEDGGGELGLATIPAGGIITRGSSVHMTVTDDASSAHGGDDNLSVASDRRPSPDKSFISSSSSVGGGVVTMGPPGQVPRYYLSESPMSVPSESEKSALDIMNNNSSASYSTSTATATATATGGNSIVLRNVAVSMSTTSTTAFSLPQKSPWATYASVSHTASASRILLPPPAPSSATTAAATVGFEEGADVIPNNTAAALGAGGGSLANSLHMQGAQRIREQRLIWDKFFANVPDGDGGGGAPSIRQGTAMFLKTRGGVMGGGSGTALDSNSSTGGMLGQAQTNNNNKSSVDRIRSISTMSVESANSSSGKGSEEGAAVSRRRRSSRSMHTRNSFTSEYRTPIRALGSFSSVSSFSVSSVDSHGGGGGGGYGNGSSVSGGSRRNSATGSVCGNNNEATAFDMPLPIIEGWLMRRLIPASETNGATGLSSEKSAVRIEGTIMPAIPTSPSISSNEAALAMVGNSHNNNREKDRAGRNSRGDRDNGNEKSKTSSSSSSFSSAHPSTSSSSSWLKRYFVLYPDFEGGGTTLFFYVKAQDALRMKTRGVETQRGFLRMSSVKSIVDSQIEGRTPHLDIITSNGIWRLAEEGPDKASTSTSLGSWARALTAAVLPSSVVCGRL